jgi:hypothetical protein
MGFRQLYYTSCETGLSGYAGFQFNAATPGVPPEVMREVEALTSYEPPSSVPYNATAEQIRNCPVNLCFGPSGASGASGVAGAVLANVVFVGHDYSHRFGNYFAHALVAEGGPDDLGDVLPIELWRARFWATDAVAEPDLPEMARLPGRGEITRAGVAAFIDTHPSRGLLPALLCAVARVADGEKRTVVIIEEDSDAVAHWIGAVSFLLPPDLARQVSFATYHHRPAYSDLDVVGTVVDADVDRSAGAFASFLQFDIPAGRASEVTVEPWAQLLVDTGVEDAPALWQAATLLAGGPPSGPDDWFALLAAAVFDRGSSVPTGPGAAEAAARWLASRASRLGRGTVERIGFAALDVVADERSSDATLVDLAEAARVADLGALQVGVERAAMDNLVNGLLEGRSDGTPVQVPIKSPEGRHHASQRCTEVLVTLPPERAITLLTWAARTFLDLDAALLRSCGRRLVGPLVLDGADDTTRRLMAAWPPLRQGALGHLDIEAQRDPGRVITALVGRTDLELTRQEAKRAPALYEALLVATSRHDPQSRPRALGMIVKSRRDAGVSHVVDSILLSRLWPDGHWTAGEAVAVLKVLDGEAATSPEVVQWFEAVFGEAGAARAKSSFEDLDVLCRAVGKSPVYGSLSQQARTSVDGVLRLERELKNASGPVKKAAVLATGLDKLPHRQQQHNLGKLMEIIEGAYPEDIATIFSSCPRSVVTRYLDQVHPELRNDRARADVAAGLYYAMYRLEEGSDGARRTAKYIEPRLLDPLVTWKWSYLKELERELGKLDQRVADDFAEWRDLEAGGLLRRILTKRRIKKREEAPAKAAAKAEKEARRAREKEAEAKEAKRRAAAKKAVAKKREAEMKVAAQKEKEEDEKERRAAAQKKKQDAERKAVAKKRDEERRAAARKKKRDEGKKRQRR